MRRTLITLFLFASIYFNTAFAQLNIKVGYSAGFSNPELFNTILDEYNSGLPWLSQPLEDMKYLQGLQLGLRYRFGPAAIDFTWHNRFKRTKAEGIDPVDETNFKRDIGFRMSSYALGIENFVGNFSYGASFDLNTLNLKTKKTGRSDRYTIGDDQFDFGSHFFVSYTFEASPLLYFCIRPYVQVPWSKFDLKALSDELNPGTDYADYQDDFMNFGVMFIFFNGE